jgi:hypothetical protein
MREAQRPVCAKSRPSLAICWRRANQRARQLFLYDAIATGINGHCAKKELKSGNLAPPLPSRAARRQRNNQPELGSAQRSAVLHCWAMGLRCFLLPFVKG